MNPFKPFVRVANKIKLAILLALMGPLVGGCAGTFSLEGARANGLATRPKAVAAPAVISSDSCASLSMQNEVWGGIAVGSALASGGAGIPAIPVTDPTTKDALVGVAVGLAVTAAVAAFEQQTTATSWAAQCSARASQ
jgi:hypothetical protein